jgi:N6-adenosine-specific RNA methylase IME4
MSTSERSCTPFSTRRKYGVIYADPPWSFRNWSAKGTGRNAISHCDCLDFSALASLPVARLAADDCALFLWATDPLLPRAFELIQRWGFEYKTVAFYWVKLNSTARRGLFHGPWILDPRQPRTVLARDTWQAAAPSQGREASCC